MTTAAVPITAQAGQTCPISRDRAPGFTSPSVPGWTPAPKCCRAIANSPITPFRRKSAIRRSRARTRIARSTVSRSTPPGIWAATRASSRCIERGALPPKMPGLAGHFYDELRVLRLHFLHDRLAHLGRADSGGTLGLDIGGAQPARQHRGDGGVD